MNFDIYLIATVFAVHLMLSTFLFIELGNQRRKARYWRREHDLLDAYFTQYRRNSIRRDRQTGRYIKED